MYPKIHSNVVYNSQDMEATQVSINKQMDKEDIVNIYKGILATEKEWNFATCRTVDRSGGYYSGKDKHCYPFVCGILKKQKRSNKTKQTDTESKQVAGCQWGEEIRIG